MAFSRKNKNKNSGLLFSFSSLPNKAQRKKYVFFFALNSPKAKKRLPLNWDVTMQNVHIKCK